MQKRPLPVNIIFWGTSEFALPSLAALTLQGYGIAAVITNPDEPAGRKAALTAPPVKTWLKNQNQQIELLQPERLDKNFRSQIADLEPQLFVVAAYGKILPKEILDIPKYGALNIHPSLLPRWRGPSPIQYAILNGDLEAGVTIIKMDEEMDHGPILAQRESGISKLQITNYKPTYKEQHDRLAKLGAKLLIETLPKWVRGEITPVPQDESKATYSKILTKDGGRIDWSKSAEEIERMIRAFNLWPGAWTACSLRGQARRLRISEADILADTPAGVPGMIWKNSAHPLLVKTGNGCLAVKTAGIEGRKLLPAADFIRGYPELLGTVLE